MFDYNAEADQIFDEAYEHAAEYHHHDLTAVVHRTKYLCLFGTGKVFQDSFHYLEYFHSCKVNFLCDNDQRKWGTSIKGIKCLSLDELCLLKNDVAIVITVDHWMPIAIQLRQLGFRHVFVLWRWLYGNSKRFESPRWLLDAKEQFNKMLTILHDDTSRRLAIRKLNNVLSRDILQIDYQDFLSGFVPDYFPENLFKLKPDECFVDAGAYTGDTLLAFLDRCKNSFEHSHHFELDARNYKLLEQTISELSFALHSRISLYPFGLWDSSQEVSFSGEGAGSAITESEHSKTTHHGFVHKLDSVLNGKKITIIKMDVEGAEVPALKGASDIISRQHPRLSICIYHRIEDLWEIPLLIKELYPHYRIQLRHYSRLDWETICYAVAQ